MQKLQKLMKSTSKSEQAVNTKRQKYKKTSYTKEQIENTDLYKPVLIKIMATQKQCVKNNFVAPLSDFSPVSHFYNP